MKEIPFYQADAFVEGPFSGNPAAVCILKDWLPSPILQCIAMENNLSETAFVVQKDDRFHIRWFTPATEVELCGHATLATAHILHTEGYARLSPIRFDSLSGELSVEINGDMLTLDFPSMPPVARRKPKQLLKALGIDTSVEIYENGDLLVVVENQEIVQQLNPDLAKLKTIPVRGVIVTARGNSTDFVSRFFGPQVGVDEDPVTGSAHCILTPFWSKRLQKSKMEARQLSQRGGHLTCEDCGSRVKISGKAKTVIRGSFFLI